MKANAPEKLYIFNPEKREVWFSKTSDKQVEYVRTDAFIEKAVEWVSMNFDKIGEHYYEYVMVGTEYNPEHFVDDIKNYIKGEE